MMDKDVELHLTKVVDYLWHDEKKHYEEESPSPAHIFNSLRVLRKHLAWVKKPTCCGKPMYFTAGSMLLNSSGEYEGWICLECGEYVIEENGVFNDEELEPYREAERESKGE